MAIARKHIDIALRLKRIAVRICPGCTVFPATYTGTGVYQRIEEQSCEEFWSIRGYCPPEPSPETHVKDPDAIIAEGDRVRYAIEIKWGAVPGVSGTDMLLAQAAWLDLAAKLRAVAVYRVRGPAVRAGTRYRSGIFAESNDFRVDGETKILLVADVDLLRRALPALYEEMLRSWTQAGRDPPLANVGDRVEEIPALRDALAGGFVATP